MALPVVVLGAGLSGLHAARLLEQRGHEVRLIEARSRAGGRILVWPAADGVHGYDLGPSWVWPAMNPRMARLLDALGCTLYPQHVQGGAVIEGPEGGVQRVGYTWSPAPPSMRVTGGMTALVDALAGDLRATRLQLDTRVTALQLDDHGVLLTTHRGECVRAERVISTLPPRLLAGILELSSPGLPGDWLAARRATPTWMAGQAKFVARYEHAFWRDEGLSGMAMSQRGPLVEIHDASDPDGHQAALFGFIGLDHGKRQALGRETLERLAVEQLARLFGPRAGQPRAMRLKDWTEDACTATAADAITAPGHPGGPVPTLPAPWQDRVRLAGTELASDFAGYLEGALASAERAVATI